MFAGKFVTLKRLTIKQLLTFSCAKIQQFPETSKDKLIFFDLFEANKKVEVGFSAPEMTNLGGMCVLRRITKDDDFVGELARKVREWRNPKFTEHSIKEMMDQRVLQIAAGYEDADDCDLLRKDGMMKLMVGRLPSGGDLCSQPTMTRLENHVQHKELYDMGWAFVRHFVESYDKEPVKIILDLDDSNANCYGAQQLSVFNGYYGEYCYMPLFIFEGFSGKLVVPILRPGRTNKRDNVAGLLIRLITYLCKFWPDTVIVVRGDGMFSSSEFMEWANGQKNLHYVLGFSGNSHLSQRTAAWVARAEEQKRRTGQDVKVYHRFMYRATRWERAQWIVVKIEFNAEGKNVRYVVTDMYHKPPRDVYANWYCKRGNCELYIYDKYFVMRSYSKCMFDYQNVTALLLVSALHNNMAAMTLFHLNVRTNGHHKVPF